MASPSSTNCTICKDLDESFGDDEFDDSIVNFANRVKLSQIRDAMLACPICCLVWQGVDKFVPEQLKTRNEWEDNVTVHTYMKRAVGTLEAHVVMKDDQSLREGDILRRGEYRGTILVNDFLEFYTPEDQEPPWPAFGKARRLLSPTFSDFESGGLVHTWIRDCTSNHESCRADGLLRPLPTRVIDVFGNAASHNDPFLYETRGELGQYICLSYCWGNIAEGFLTTTTGTLEQRKICIKAEELPQVFADAIWVARSLNIRFIWIDSLCIVQDDPKDWERESAAMASVFGNAYVTIAAQESPNVQSGMFYAPSMDDGEQGTIEVVAFRSDLERTSVQVRKRVPHHDAETASPLAKRGWTLQESLLSKRVIYLGLYEPRWVCNEMSTCRCTLRPQESDDLRKDFFTASAAAVSMPAKDRWKLWSDLVFEYTNRELTKGTDKLVALSGIAKSLQGLWDCRYLAGLWQTEILTCLRWQLNNYRRRSPRPRPYRAPTWTWASIDGQVSYPWGNYPAGSFWQVSVISVDCQPTTEDPTGQVSGGQLALSGKLISAEFIYESHSEPDIFSGTAVLDSLYINSERITVQADVDLTNLTSDGLPYRQEAYCLLLGAFGKEFPPPPDEADAKPMQEFSVLILQKSESDCEKFERIGIINSHGDDVKNWFKGVEDIVLTII